MYGGATLGGGFLWPRNKAPAELKSPVDLVTPELNHLLLACQEDRGGHPQLEEASFRADVLADCTPCDLLKERGSWGHPSVGSLGTISPLLAGYLTALHLLAQGRCVSLGR